MEFADKGDLYQKITQFKKMGCLMEETDAWRIFIQMTRGLKSLHELKILHRDLKSANIFLFGDGSAKIGDLNVSKVAKKGLGYTQTGTPYYASPEVWNDKPYDSKSDIWSLGCVTYEMLTLRPPFRAENMEGLYNKVIKGQYNKIPDRYSNDLSEVLKMMLKVNPNERPSCSQILKHPLVMKRIEYFQATSNMENIDFDNMDEGELLKTIRIPKNILFLTDKLPGANYETNKTSSTNVNHMTENNAPKAKTKSNNKIYSFLPTNLPEIKLPSQRNRKADNLKIEHNNSNDNSNIDNNHNNNHNNNINNNSNNLNTNENNKISNNIIRNSNNINHVNREEISGLPSLNKNDIFSSRNNPPQIRIVGTKKSNNINIDKYLHDKYKIYVPHLDYNYNGKHSHSKNPKKLINEEKYYNLYMPKKNINHYNYNYNKIIPNRKLNPLRLKN